MAMRVLLADDGLEVEWFQDAALGRYDLMLCLFWAAPETRTRLVELAGGAVLGLRDVVGTTEAWERGATEMVEVICASGPQYGGLRWRSYLEERLFVPALGLELMRRVFERMRAEQAARGATEIEVEFVLQRDLETPFRLMLETEGEGVRVRNVAPPPAEGTLEARPALPLRLYRRWRAMRVSGRGGAQVRELLAQLDSRYVWRVLWKRLRGVTPKPGTGRVVFFSSYANNSRRLVVFEGRVEDGMVDWLLLTDSARRGADGARGPVFWLWDFADGRGTPEEVRDAVTVEAEPDGTRRAWLERWLGSLGVWEDWVRSELPTLVQLTRFWEAFLERAEPREIVMANQWAVEGWLMQVAQARGTRVVQLLHGVLGGYFYTQRPRRGDDLRVWGEFWRDLFWEGDRDKIVVEDASGFFPQVVRRAGERRTLTFFSWPLLQLPYYNASELWGGILGLLEALAGAGYGVILRLHPLENAATVVDLWGKRFGALPATVRVSQREPLGEVLAVTDVALMFRSTVLMDCMVNGIPMLMPGWIDFGWNDALEGEGGVYLARGWSDLEEKAREWLRVGARVSGGGGRFVRGG